MPNANLMRRWFAVTTATVAALVLTGCMLSAGKFTSALDLRRDSTFSYAYNGEIYLLGLSKLAEMERGSRAPEEFAASLCYVENADEPSERECTKDELAQQRTDWDEQQKLAAENKQREGVAMRTMLGGIDPGDPKAAEEIAARLRKQAGWRSVEYKGDGLFVVDFAIAGRLDHDFVFPTIERMPQANAFVTLARRNDGTVRVDAPGFSAGMGGDPFRTMMGLAAMGEAAEAKDNEVPKLPELAGTFTLTTDAEILANNTEDGPSAVTTGKQLKWTISVRTEQAPTALVKLAP